MSTKEGVYIAGDYLLLCDVCGFKKRRSETLKRWDGAMVCREDYEERHPLDMVQPRADRQNVLDARYAEPVYVDESALFMNLPGTAGAFAQTGNSSAFSFAGDFDIRMRLSLDNWGGNGAGQVLVSKGGTGINAFRIAMGGLQGRFSFQWSSDGGNYKAAFVAVSTFGMVNGSPYWIRFVLASDSDYTLTLYSSFDGSTWTQEATASGLASHSIFESPAPMSIGADGDGTGAATGKVYRIEIYDGSTLATSFDAEDGYPGAMDVTSAATGEVYRLLGNAEINATSGGGVQPSDL